nr:MAG TPA: hypothetical protein [Caudoviricetes sp.]
MISQSYYFCCVLSIRKLYFFKVFFVLAYINSIIAV